MKRPFEPDFYFAAVTVIPILYLALTLQGPVFERLINHWQHDLDDIAKHSLERKSGGTKRSAAAHFHGVLGLLGTAFILSGIVAEFISFLALYNRSSNSFIDNFTLASIAGLLAVVSAKPFVNFLGTYFLMLIVEFIRRFETLDKEVFVAGDSSKVEEIPTASSECESKSNESLEFKDSNSADP